MDYTFQTSEYDVNALVPEVRGALKKRIEVYSRKRIPLLWKIIDKFPKRDDTKELSDSQRLYRRIIGFSLVGLGVILIVPGVIKQLVVPLLAGGVGIGIGCRLVRSTLGGPKCRTDRYAKAAQAFLYNTSSSKSVEVSFSFDGMQIAEQKPVPFENIAYLFETTSGYLITWKDRGVFLQKKDMTTGTPEKFAKSVSNQLKDRYVVC